MRKFAVASALLLVFALAVAAPAAARVYIDITQPFSRMLPLALPEFQPQQGAAGDPAGAEATRLLAANLGFTGLFDILDPKGYLATPVIGQVQYKRWTVIGAELLVVADYNTSGNEINMRCALYDVVDAKRLVGISYNGTRDQLPAMMARFADEIMLALTGDKSVFSTEIAFVSANGGKKEIKAMRYDGSGVRNITTRGDLCLYPAWNSTGDLIAYSAYEKRRPAIFVHSLKGGSGRVVINKPGVNITPDFQPGTGNLAVSMSHTGRTNLFLVSLTGQILKRLTDGWGIEVAPSFSPDGKQLAFVSDRGGTPQIYILDLVGGQVRRLTYGMKYCSSPAWSPKGDKIAFQVMIDGVFQVATAGPDGSALSILTSGHGGAEDPSWSPDGRLLAYASRKTGRYQIYVMTAEGRPIRRLTNLPGEQTDPAWSPSGVVK